MISAVSIVAQVSSGSPVPIPTSAPTGSVDGMAQLTMPSIDWVALLPVIILALGALVLLTITSLVKGRFPKGGYAVYTVVVALAAALSVLPLWARVQGWSQLGWVDLHPNRTGAFSTAAEAVGIDGFGLFVIVLICAAVIIGALLADDYLRREGLEGPELYVLLLFSGAGGVIMATANDLIVLFLGLETLSIAAYVLTAMNLKRSQSQEGGLKYFILGAFSSAFFLYGIAMTYGATGSTNFISIKNFMAGTVPIYNGLLMLGIALLIVGLGFKVSAVPFHSWSPDAYDGAPTPTVAYMVAGVKAAAFAGMVRVFVLTFSNYSADWKPIIYTLAILSLVVGAVLGLVQGNVKRMLAYSSISHAGFILMAVEAGSDQGNAAVLFYLAAYTFMVAGSFGVVTLVARKGDARHDLSEYRGLSRTSPALAVTLTVFLLAQTGVPFTSGFFAKFYAITAATAAHSYPLAAVAMFSAAISAFIYVRIIVAMYMDQAEGHEAEEPARDRVPVPLGARVALGICLVVTLVVGIFPATVVNPARQGQPQLVEESTQTAPTPVLPTGPAGG